MNRMMSNKWVERIRIWNTDMERLQARRWWVMGGPIIRGGVKRYPVRMAEVVKKVLDDLEAYEAKE